jgi:hypothetical protein
MRCKLVTRIVLASLTSAALAVGGCSSHAPSHPPALGDCVAINDASCGTQALGGGGGSPGGGGSVPADGGTAVSQSDAAAPAADSASSGADACSGQTVTTNAACQSCLQQSCCDACLTDVNCAALIMCAETMCAAGDSTCLAAVCENLVGPAQVSAYDAFAGCLAFNCSTQCPALP